MTAQELLALSDDDLRLEVTKTLEPMPWLHRTGQVDGYTPGSHCRKCGQEFPRHGYARSGFMAYSAPGCPVPDPAEGSWADLAVDLVMRCNWDRLMNAARDYYDANPDLTVVKNPDPARWLFHMNLPRTQVVLCLLALQSGKERDQ